MEKQMEKQEEYDFFTIGQSHAADGFMELKKIANMYAKDFGEEAKYAFELGVASIFPTYGKYTVTTTVTSKEAEAATSVYGKDNQRNNSYFGYPGTSEQYRDGVYNEPSGKTMK